MQFFLSSVWFPCNSWLLLSISALDMLSLYYLLLNIGFKGCAVCFNLYFTSYYCNQAVKLTHLHGPRFCPIPNVITNCRQSFVHLSARNPHPTEEGSAIQCLAPQEARACQADWPSGD